MFIYIVAIKRDVKNMDFLNSIINNKQNVSFIPKAPESFANDKERWDYLYVLHNIPMKNEATIMDYLSQFEKFGGKMYDKSTTRDSITDVGTVVECFVDDHKSETGMLNRIIKKYIDIISKFATNELPGGGYSPDAAELLPYYNHCTDVMTKDTVIKFINAFKNIAVDKQEYRDISYFLKDGTWQYFYRQLKAEDLPDIQKALDEFAVAVRNLPDDIMKIN